MTTNLIYSLVGLLLIARRLTLDFKKDKGLNTKAKIFQAILLGFIVVNYASSIRYVGWMFRHFDRVVERFTVQVGIFPGNVHFVVFLLNVLLMVTVLVIAFNMASRHEKARQTLFYILPLLALTEVFNFYRGWLSDGDEAVGHGVILAIGLVLAGMLTGFILLVYRSSFMRSFYNFKIPETPDVKIDLAETQNG